MAPLLNESSVLLATQSPPRKNGNNEARQVMKRRVYFVEEKNTVCEYQAIDSTDFGLVASLWQQPWEMLEVKQDLKVRARNWRSTGLGILLADTFLCDNDLHARLCQKQINAFAQLPDELYNRGVERYLSRKHDQERTTRKRSIVREIVTQAITLRNANGIPIQEQEDYLSQFAQRLNRDAALFARRLGRADEVVMRKGAAENDEAAYRVVDYLIHLENERTASQPAAAVMPTHERPSPMSGRTVAVGQLKSPPPSQQQQSNAAVGKKGAASGRRIPGLQARQA